MGDIDNIIQKHLDLAAELVKEHFGMTLWECALEDALCKASPEEIVHILQKVRGWTGGYCPECGHYDDGHKGRYCEHQRAKKEAKL